LIGPPVPEFPGPTLLEKIKRIEFEGFPAPKVYAYQGYVAATSITGLPVTAEENVENWHAAKLASVSTIPVHSFAHVTDAVFRQWMKAATRSPKPVKRFFDDNELEDAETRLQAKQQVQQVTAANTTFNMVDLPRPPGRLSLTPRGDDGPDDTSSSF